MALRSTILALPTRFSPLATRPAYHQAPRLPTARLHLRPFAAAAAAARQLRSMSSAAQQIPKTQKVLLIEKQEGLEAIQQKEVPVPTVQAGEVLIKVSYAGINYIDNYKMGGLYPVALPFTLGEEAAGVVVDVHSSVTDVKVGQHVAAYQSGCYAEYIVAKADKVAVLPSSISLKSAAGLVVQGLTALTQLRESYAVKKGDYILVHAAAGGVGLNLCQMASHFGAHVIGTTSTLEKADLAKKNGAEVVVVGGDADALQKEVDRLTGGLGVHAIYDGVGKATWEANWSLLRRQGTMVTFGNASGPVPEILPAKLAKGNWKLTRPTLNNAIVTSEEWKSYTKEMFDLVDAGVVRLLISETYPFTADGLRGAHKALTGRQTVGKLVIEVSKE